MEWTNHHCVGSLSCGLCSQGSIVVVVVEAEARRRHGVRKHSSHLQRHSPSRRSSLPLPSLSSPVQLHFSRLRSRSGSTFRSAMRIRKGARCVLPMVPVDRSCLRMKGFARREDIAEQPVPEAGVLAAAAAAAICHGCSEDLARGYGTSSAGTERLDDDRVRKRLSADERSRKRPAIAEGVISISSIIQAGVKSTPRRNSRSAPASGESDVTSVASLTKSPTDGSPSIAQKIMDQSNLLLQSLKNVCSAAENTGLTAKEAVAKILEHGLPGLIEGGERLIVQVAKLFRSSSLFVEREERGRFVVQESFHELMGWGKVQTVDANIKREKAVPNGAGTESERVIKAGMQLAKLQSIRLEPVDESVGKSGTGKCWVLALSAIKSGEEKSSSKKSLQRDPESGLLRCNREDGRGWRCVRLAESGFSSCNYHRELTRRAEGRRRKTRSKFAKRRNPRLSAPVQPEKPSNPTFEDVKTVNVPEEDKTVDANSHVSDNKRRRFVKAKSLKYL